MISILAVLADCDVCLTWWKTSMLPYFNPRGPCGLRRHNYQNKRGKTMISILAVLADCDRVFSGSSCSGCNFNPRGPCGLRLRVPFCYHGPIKFQSSRSLRTATAKTHKKLLRLCTKRRIFSSRQRVFCGKSGKTTFPSLIPAHLPVRTRSGSSGRLALALDHQGLFRQVGLLAAKVLDLVLVLFSQVVKAQTVPLRVHDRNELCLQCPALGRVQQCGRSQSSA